MSEFLSYINTTNFRSYIFIVQIFDTLLIPLIICCYNSTAQDNIILLNFNSLVACLNQDRACYFYLVTNSMWNFVKHYVVIITRKQTFHFRANCNKNGIFKKKQQRKYFEKFNSNCEGSGPIRGLLRWPKKDDQIGLCKMTEFYRWNM